MTVPKQNPKKALLANLMARTGVSALLGAVTRRVWGSHARAVNYHDVSSSMLPGFERHLEYFQRHYANVGRSELDALIEGRWESDRPGLLLTFDDGLRSHGEHVAPLLEKYGFTGWFFVPSQFVDTPEDQQREFASEHAIGPHEEDFMGERVALSWDEIRDLDARGHVIGSHTQQHVRLETKLTPEQLEHEIVGSKQRLEEELSHEVDVFCWVGGEEWAYSRAAADVIQRAGYRLGFMTNNLPIRPGSDPMQIQRTNLEAWYPSEMFAMQLSGILDLIYTGKRRRVNRLTAARESGHQ